MPTEGLKHPTVTTTRCRHNWRCTFAEIFQTCHPWNILSPRNLETTKPTTTQNIFQQWHPWKTKCRQDTLKHLTVTTNRCRHDWRSAFRRTSSKNDPLGNDCRLESTNRPLPTKIWKPRKQKMHPPKDAHSNNLHFTPQKHWNGTCTNHAGKTSNTHVSKIVKNAHAWNTNQ